MIVNLKSETDLSGFYIVFNGSSNLEKRGIYGISHLMEHLICKNFESLRDDFEREGIDWNAYTSQNEIVFYFTGLDKYLSRRRSQLVDLICDFKTTKSQFENERKIVLQEYTNDFTDQTNSHFLNLERKILNNYNAIGLRQDLESLTYMDCIKFFEEQFNVPTKIINVSKDSPFNFDIDFFSPKSERKFELSTYKDVFLEKTHNYGDKCSLILLSKISENDFNYISFLNNMLSLGLSSPFLSEIREKKGLIYGIQCKQHRLNKQGITTITTQTSSKNVDEVVESINYIFSNPNKFLTKKRFDIIRNSFNINYQKEKISRYANVNLWINPPGWSIKEILNTMTYDKVMDIFDQHYKFEDFYISNDRTEFT